MVMPLGEPQMDIYYILNKKIKDFLEEKDHIIFMRSLVNADIILSARISRDVVVCQTLCKT